MELYRYRTFVHGDAEVELELEKFIVIKETPQGYWFIPLQTSTHNLTNDEWVQKNKRWVSSNSRKRYCYPTLDEAFNSFTIRSARRLEYVRRHLWIAEQAITLTREGITSRNNPTCPLASSWLH